MATRYNYNTGIPAAPNLPANDQPLMQTNTNSINSIIGTDHLTFNQASGALTDGMHTVVHLVQQSGDPSKVSGSGMLYTKSATFNSKTDEALFFESSELSGNTVIQITAPKAYSLTSGTSTVAGSGYSFLPGGLIMQWGTYAANGGNFSSGSTTNASAGESAITLPITFPTNLFFVSGNLLYTTSNLPSGTGTLNVRGSQLSSGSVSSLSWQVYCNTNNYLGFNWMAIGN